MLALIEVSVNVRFPCPACDAAVTADRPGPVRCPACQHESTLREPPAAGFDGCLVCSCPDLYRQKDFPQWLGLGVLTFACAAFFVLQILYRPTLAWVVLLGSAALDAFVYFVVGDVVLCYRCGAQHRGRPAKGVDPFELATAERYRQERLRREQLQAGGRA